MIQKCSRCKANLSVDNFHLNSSVPGGRGDRCKMCVKKAADLNYEKCRDFTGSKRCGVCKEVKPYTDFSKSKHGTHGLQGACKMCNKIQMARWYARKASELGVTPRTFIRDYTRKIRLTASG